MLILSENKINELKDRKYKVYSKEPLKEGVECFPSSKSFNENEKFCITSVSSRNIRKENGKYYYTAEDLSSVADWFPAQCLDIGSNFVPCKKSSKLKCVKPVGKNVGKSIKGYGCLIDASSLPAFNGVNEDASVNEYRLYITLFNDYTVKQCQYERHNLHDAVFTSSKYDLAQKIQNSDFLKSKDFTMINYKRQNEESVPVGLVIREDSSLPYGSDYGKVYIDMDNKISIVWH